jgi:septal ring factor EnvC (AmiA/AmiB activator)
MEQDRESLSELTQREEKLYSDLVGLKKRIKSLTTRMSDQEKKLQRKQGKKQSLVRKNKKLMRRISEGKQAVREMLPHLWSLYVKSRGLGPGELISFENIRRDYSWLTSVYRMAQERLASLNAQQRKLETNLGHLRRVEQNIAEQLENIEATKEKLLQKKLTYLNKLQKVRAERLAKREQLELIENTIKDLRYKLKNKKKQNIGQLKGELSWPALGKVVRGANSDERGSDKGLAFSLERGQKVRSVAWGKVVYNDKLRGFGQVVIIFHGGNYYSLYAYLMSSQVETGQDIDRDEPIGRAGFNPRVNGPGLYFELRHGQRPIDPEPWLGDRRGKG